MGPESRLQPFFASSVNYSPIDPLGCGNSYIVTSEVSHDSSLSLIFGQKTVHVKLPFEKESSSRLKVVTAIVLMYEES